MYFDTIVVNNVTICFQNNEWLSDEPTPIPKSDNRPILTNFKDHQV